jgi:hypothetical protein
MFHLFNKIYLDGFLILDREKDTLLSLKTLEASFDGKSLRAIMGYRQVHWGPSKGDALILGKNSPAFLQASIGTGEKGIAVLKGQIKWEILAGLLASPQFAYDDNGFREAGASIVLPKREQQRYINGFDINYTRGKKAAFTVGLNHLSMFYPDKEKRVHRYLPLLSYPFSLKAPLENEPASMGSMYVKLKVPADHLELWAEYGYADRGIFPLSPLLQDTAKYGYTFGVSKLKPIGAKIRCTPRPSGSMISMEYCLATMRDSQAA